MHTGYDRWCLGVQFDHRKMKAHPGASAASTWLTAAKRAACSVTPNSNSMPANADESQISSWDMKISPKTVRVGISHTVDGVEKSLFGRVVTELPNITRNITGRVV